MLVPEFQLPAADTAEDCIQVLGKLAAPEMREIEPVGRWYEAYMKRRLAKHTLSNESLGSSSSEEEEEEVVDDFDDDKDDLKLLQKLDPKNWKEQDHYAVLGLSKLRYKATEDQVKRAYKRKVLKHHPDKRRSRGIQVLKEGEEDYFTCITRAYEVLGVKSRRRAFDSVDPTFDDTIPTVCTESKEKFYEIFRPVFERNARWSTKRGVPSLGDESTSYDDVNHFYSFWYEFESWREYSYQDEEEKEKGENRDERRWIEKQNKAARKERKKEETARIRQLVDNAWACDTRIQRYKAQEKERKMAEKKAKQDAARQKVEEEEQMAEKKAKQDAARQKVEEEEPRKQKEQEEERLKKEKEEEAAKAQHQWTYAHPAAVLKKEKEAQKKVLKQERKVFRTTMKDLDYLTPEGAERVQAMAEVDKLAELLSITSLQALNAELSSDDKEKAKQAFNKQVREMKEESEREMQKLLAAQKQGGGSGGGGDGSKSKNNNWSEAEVQMLIKAVNLFPAGTNARWETINNFLKLHVPESNRTPKDVLAKAKDLQKNDTSLKDEANKKAFEKFSQQQQTSNHAATAVPSDSGEVSQRYESAAETLMYEVGSNPAPWTADEQKLLEQAMRTYPATQADRWDKIAECLPARSKKDCMKRYKELVELIRSKKLAQAQTASATKKK